MEFNRWARRYSRFSLGIPEMRSIFAERVSQGFYLNVEVNRPEAARYGLTVGGRAAGCHLRDWRRRTSPKTSKAASAIPINVRYERDFRDNVDGAATRALIATPSGAQIPIAEVATMSFSRGPAMIRDEDGAADRLRLHRSEDQGLRRLRQPSADRLLQREAAVCPRATPTNGRENTNLSCVPKNG